MNQHQFQAERTATYLAGRDPNGVQALGQTSPDVYDLREAFSRMRVFHSRSSVHGSIEPQIVTTLEASIYLGRTEDWVRRNLERLLKAKPSGPIRMAKGAPLRWRKRDLDWLIDQDDWEAL